jgi:hypothetical protein
MILSEITVKPNLLSVSHKHTFLVKTEGLSMNILNKSELIIDAAINALVQKTSFITDAIFYSNGVAFWCGLLMVFSVLLGFTLKSFRKDDDFFVSILIRAIGKLLIGLFFIMLVIVFTSLATTLGRNLNSHYDYYQLVYSSLLPITSQNLASGLIAGAILSVLIYVYIRTYLHPIVGKFADKISVRSKESTEIPDLTNIETFLPKRIEYDPMPRIKQAMSQNKIFLGLDIKTRPVFISIEKALTGSTQVGGGSGSGKGVFLQMMAYQFIQTGHINIVFNPKPDEWAPSVLQQACFAAKRPFYVLNLNGQIPCINPLAGCIKEEFVELICSTCDLETSAAESAYYLQAERSLTRNLSNLFDRHDDLTIPDILDLGCEIFADSGREANGLQSKLFELAQIDALQTQFDGGLSDVYENGGCILIEGSPHNQSSLLLMKMIFNRVVQMTSNRKDKSIPVNIFADEVKFLLSTSLINTLGVLRDKNGRLFCANQSNADFEAGTLRMPANAVRESFLDNTPNKIFYTTGSRNTAEWISHHCGTRNTFEETEITGINELAAETLQHERRIKRIEEPVFHPNLIQNLPKSCAIITGFVDQPTLVFLSPIRVPKVEVTPVFAKRQIIHPLQAANGDNLL